MKRYLLLYDSIYYTKNSKRVQSNSRRQPVFIRVKRIEISEKQALKIDKPAGINPIWALKSTVHRIEIRSTPFTRKCVEI